MALDGEAWIFWVFVGGEETGQWIGKDGRMMGGWGFGCEGVWMGMRGGMTLLFTKGGSWEVVGRIIFFSGSVFRRDVGLREYTRYRWDS